VVVAADRPGRVAGPGDGELLAAAEAERDRADREETPDDEHDDHQGPGSHR
jgi:hypothetical protein